MPACVLSCVSVKFVLSGDVCVGNVFLPLAVFSARVERSGLSMQTLSRSMSEMHILSHRETERGEGVNIRNVQ